MLFGEGLLLCFMCMLLGMLVSMLVGMCLLCFVCMLVCMFVYACMLGVRARGLLLGRDAL